MDGKFVFVFCCSTLLLFVHQIAASCGPAKVNPDSSYSPIQRRYYVGDTIVYRCRSGCHLLGFSTRRCVFNRGLYQWNGSPPLCRCTRVTYPPVHPTTAQQYYCSTPTTPPHGIVNVYTSQTRYSVGAKVTYQCKYGYTLVGDPVATCGHHGWSHVPKCKGKCTRPENPSYGRVVSANPHQTDYIVGGWVRYECSAGYCIQGDPTVYCQSHGWSHTPSCAAGCKKRAAPKYGSSGDASKQNWCPGDRATYHCNYGYRMSGFQRSTCGKGGKWDKDVPKCLKVCGAARAPRYGRVTSPPKDDYVEDQSYTYSCDIGYCRANGPIVYCRHSGWTHYPACNKGCEDRKPPSYGSYDGKSKGWCPGTKAGFRCNYGFRLYGHSSSSCGKDGKWDHPVPSCKRVCGKAQDLQYGEVVPSSSKASYEEGDFVTYRCKPGYCLYGNPRVPCGHKGFGDMPQCKRQCTHRNAPSYGSYHGSNTKWCPGQRARYQCNPTFRMNGHESSKCQDDGSWEYDVPTCKKICPRPADPQYGYVFSPRTKREYVEDESIRYRCNTGYCMRGNPIAYCRHTGFTRAPSCGGGCKNRGGPSYGSYVNPRKHYCPGDSAGFKCNDKFRLYGSATSYCGSNGEWRTPVPRCRRVCGKAQDLQYGEVVPSSSKASYEEGDFVTYRCKPGYCLYGNPRVPCGHKGFGGMPQCRRQCTHRNAPSYGSYHSDSRSHTKWCPGQRARYQCNPTFRMSGHEYSRCQNNGSWDYDVPACKKICPRPADPQYGHVLAPRSKREYVEDESVAYRCNNGYCMHGNPTAYCRHTGFTRPPFCRAGCKKRDAPSYGSYISPRSHYCPGDSAQFECDEKFRLYGSATSYCGDDDKWRTPVPRCRRVCGKAPTLLYGEVVPSSSKSSYEEGDFVIYRCRPGYCLYGNPRVPCGHKGFGDMPRCKKQCTHRNAPSYGSYHSDSRSHTKWCPGQRARYQCNPTFSMSGHEYSRCQDDGSWEYDVPACKKICGKAPSLEYGVLVRPIPSKPSYGEDDCLTYRCSRNYCMKGNPRVCCKHHGFENMPKCMAGCKKRDPPSYGSYVDPRDHYCPGNSAQFQCDKKFRLYGSATSYCGDNGLWRSPVPRCRRVCGKAPILDYGSVNSSTNKPSYEEGDHITYTCNPGYCMYGNPQVYCKHTGYGDLPKCRRQCTHRNAPSYGSYHGSNTKWCPGQRARYQCSPTFRMYGHEYSRCLNDSSWEYDVPKCKKVCRRPGNPQYGYVLAPPHKREYYEDDSVSYQCSKGYCMHGSPTAYCRHTGFTPGPSCRAGCKKRDAPSYGSYVNPRDHYCPDDSANFKCDDKFRLYGSATSRCGNDGNWKSPVPRCRRVCGKAPTVAYGSVKLDSRKSSYEEGDFLTYSCDPGYCLYGDSKVRCDHKGFGKLPRCNRGCPLPKAPGYGSISGSKLFYCPGESVRYNCSYGYEMRGNTKSTCQYNYLWDYKPPTCIKKCTLSRPPKNGYFVRSARPKITYFLDEYISVQCNTGYCGGGNMFCRKNGWDTSVSCRHGCPVRAPPAHGAYVETRRYYCPGDRANYKCKYGYQMQGHSSSTCNNNYGWDRPLPRCRRICRLPSPPLHGSVIATPSHKTTFYEDDWVSISCYSGYQLQGNSKVYCRENGWEPMPACRAYQPPTHPPTYAPSSPSCQNKCGISYVGGCSCNHNCLRGYGTCCKDFKQKCLDALAALSSSSYRK